MAVNTWSDLHRVCLEAEGDGWEAGQDGVGYVNSQSLRTHVCRHVCADCLLEYAVGCGAHCHTSVTQRGEAAAQRSGEVC